MESFVQYGVISFALGVIAYLFRKPDKLIQFISKLIKLVKLTNKLSKNLPKEKV